MAIGGGGGGLGSAGFDAISNPVMAGTGQGGLPGGVTSLCGGGGGAGWLSDGQFSRATATAGSNSGFGGSPAPSWAGARDLSGSTSGLGGLGGFGGGGGATQFGCEGAGGGGGYTGGNGNGPSNTGYGGTTFVSAAFQGAPNTIVSSQVATTTGDGLFTVEVLA